MRPAYPSASDRRATILPRSRGDVRVGAATSGGGAAGGSATGGAGSSGATGGATTTGAGGTASTEPDASVPDADLADLASIVGATVRVGGLVLDLRPDGFVLDDGTAHAPVVLRDAAAEWIPLIEPGDAINVIGRVERLDDDNPRRRRDRSGGDRPRQRPCPRRGLGRPAAREPRRRRSSPRMPGQASIARGSATTSAACRAPEPGLASLLGISLASVAVTLLRRRKARRLLAARVAARLSAFAGGEAVGEPIAVPTGRPSGP